MHGIPVNKINAERRLLPVFTCLPLTLLLLTGLMTPMVEALYGPTVAIFSQAWLITTQGGITFDTQITGNNLTKFVAANYDAVTGQYTTSGTGNNVYGYLFLP